MTADGIGLELWSDGALTGILGRYLRGVPVRRPKTPEALDHALTTGRLLLGDACLYDAAELGDLYSAAEKAAKRDAMPGTMRQIYASQEAKAGLFTIPLRWHISRADNRGHVTERWTTLPRLRWPRLTVFDFCGSDGSARGRYRIFHVTHSKGNDHTVADTGLAFRTLRDLFDHLNTY